MKLKLIKGNSQQKAKMKPQDIALRVRQEFDVTMRRLLILHDDALTSQERLKNAMVLLKCLRLARREATCA